MLDKNIEYKDIIMRIESDKFDTFANIELPDDFSFKYFEPSDIKHWGGIETSVLEFASEPEACSYFEMAYLPYILELQKRCFFILNPDGIPIATAAAWYADGELGYQASLHWVAVRPEYQGKGLGKAAVKKALNVFRLLEPGKPVWLHTQTWSYPAVKLYHSLGFSMVRNERLANMNTGDGMPVIYKNDFTEAIQVLRSVLDDGYISELINTAV